MKKPREDKYFEEITCQYTGRFRIVTLKLLGKKEGKELKENKVLISYFLHSSGDHSGYFPEHFNILVTLVWYFSEHNWTEWNTHTHLNSLKNLLFVVVVKLKIEGYSNQGGLNQR